MPWCLTTSWKVPTFCRAQLASLSPERSTVWKGWLPKGMTGPVPQRKKLAQRALAECAGAGTGPTPADSSGNESWSAGSWERSPWAQPRGLRADPPQPNPTDPGTAHCLDNRWIWMFALSLKSGHGPCQIPKNVSFCQHALLLFYLDRTKSIRLSSRHWGPLWSYTGITPMLLRSESGSGWTNPEIAAYHENETKAFVMTGDVTVKIRRFVRLYGLKICCLYCNDIYG